MADDDNDIDIYEDLAIFDGKSTEDCSEYTLELKKKCTDLEDKVVNLEKELKSLRTIKNTLEVNLSSLVKTAKTEIARKDRMITELRAELENSVFRRSNYRIPKINRNDGSKNTPPVEPIRVISDSTTRSDTASAHLDSIEPTCQKQFTPVANDRVNDDADDDVGEIYQPNKFASTVYGERLKKKIMQEDAAEKLKKEQLKLDISASEIAKRKDETNPNLVNVNKDDKENEFNQFASNDDNIEIPIKLSSKRANDGTLNGHCDKRKKTICHENETMDQKDNGTSQCLNRPAPYKKGDEKNKNRLEPTELRLTPSQKNDERLSIEKHNNDLRDDCNDKYRKRRSSSRSWSSDSNRRRNESSRSRESNRQYESNRSDHHPSVTNRFTTNKTEYRRSSRDRITEKYSSDSRSEMGSQNHVNYYRRHRPDREYDRKYELRDKREPYRRHDRSSRPQHDRVDSYAKGTKHIDERSQNQRKSSTETFSDISDDSFVSKKFETHTSPKVEDNVVIEDEVTSHTTALEDGEIVSPKSTPQKNIVNSAITEREPDKTTKHERMNDQIVTLSIDTPNIDIAINNFLISSQEENIENIAGFIKNFTHNTSNDISSTMRREPPGSLTHSPCDTTEKVTKALEYEPKDTTRIGNSENIGMPQNVVQLCYANNKNQEQRDIPPIKNSPSDIPEKEKSINNLLSELKETGTISINNVSTPYADVLSKYVRRKRKSTTSDGDSDMPEEDLRAFDERSDIKNKDESETIIDNKPLSARSKQNQDSVNQANGKEQLDILPNSVITEPLGKSPSQEDATQPTHSQNSFEIPENVTLDEGIETVGIINVKTETSETAAKLPNAEICNDYSETEKVKKNETDDPAEEIRKPTSVTNALTAGDSICNTERIHHAVCTSTNDTGKFRGTGKQTPENSDAKSDARREENRTVETLAEKNSEIQLELIREEECEDRNLNNSGCKINSCKKNIPTCAQNGKKIVVARRKKRPVQLTNSSNSLTVVLSAYNVNNNRICKSRMKMPVTLSDT